MVKLIVVKYADGFIEVFADEADRRARAPHAPISTIANCEEMLAADVMAKTGGKHWSTLAWAEFQDECTRLDERDKGDCVEAAQQSFDYYHEIKTRKK